MEITRHSIYQTDGFRYGHLTTNSSYQFSTHSHEFYELILIINGSGFYTADGRQYPLKKNTLIITHPGTVHRMDYTSDEPHERHVIQYNPQLLLPEIYNAIPKRLDVLYLDNNNTIFNCICKMSTYCHKFKDTVLEHLLLMLTEEIFCNINLVPQQSLNTNSGTGNPTILRIIDYIENNLTTLKSINDICNTLFISKSHLHYLFTEHMQITPKKYIISKRLTLAQKAIRAGRKPTEIYQECGFSSYPGFYRDYKQFFGYSPSNETAQPNVSEIAL